LIGLLAFKPHLVILLPAVLVAGGYWRAIAAATVTLGLIALLSWAAFRPDAWIVFLQSLPVASRA
jgi:glycosyl transferase family 87